MLRDRNEWYLDVAKRELDTIRGLKDEIIAAVGLETYENAWESFWQILVNTSETHFAENDGVSIAHQVFGDSPGFHFS